MRKVLPHFVLKNSILILYVNFVLFCDFLIFQITIIHGLCHLTGYKHDTEQQWAQVGDLLMSNNNNTTAFI